jgi:A/G-specific adenine glycosylase
LKRFPTIQSMAESNVDDVLLLWQGAGYYSRARRLHALSIEVMEQYSGTLPTTYDELLKLPGVGPYTAAAVSSIAFSQPGGLC